MPSTVVGVGVAIVTPGDTVVESVGVTVPLLSELELVLVGVGVRTSVVELATGSVEVVSVEFELVDDAGAEVVSDPEDVEVEELLPPAPDVELLAAGNGASGMKLQVLLSLPLPPFDEERVGEGQGMVRLVLGRGHR